jgi:hypothetical protein
VEHLFYKVSWIGPPQLLPPTLLLSRIRSCHWTPTAMLQIPFLLLVPHLIVKSASYVQSHLWYLPASKLEGIDCLRVPKTAVRINAQRQQHLEQLV